MPKLSEENPCKVCGATATGAESGMAIHGKCLECSNRVADAMFRDGRAADHEMGRSIRERESRSDAHRAVDGVEEAISYCERNGFNNTAKELDALRARISRLSGFEGNG